ncbi:probable F-box protein At2g36090 [Humulus lupulus]|uniref:probable F-box protein At2g36090 n=1 Tax=Humulus lupulus TaxID=3486 RepID=UPI002B40AA10|nr:probable F-box protein At2g36090 [Humulus lupulus]
MGMDFIPSSASLSTVDHDGAASISTLHSDIIQTHILTRLDGPTLASAGCASAQLNSLSREQSLWANICQSTWPSTSSPSVRQAISDFHGAHRSFFADSFPLITTSNSSPSNSRADDLHRTPELISAVDFHYRGELIFSKVVVTETLSGWFRCSPFRVDLLHPKDVVPTRIPYPNEDKNDDSACSNLAEELTLSWIVIDPTGRRAINLSSHKPVSVQRHWLSGEVQVRFASVLAGGGDRGSSTESVTCGAVVTCGVSQGGEMLQVREVCLIVEDMDGMHMKGKESLVILRKALEGKRVNSERREMEGKKRYEEYLERKKKRIERKARTEGTLDILSASLFGVSAVFILFWIIMFR